MTRILFTTNKFAAFSASPFFSVKWYLFDLGFELNIYEYVSESLENNSHTL